MTSTTDDPGAPRSCRAFLFFGVFTGFPELFDRVRRHVAARYGKLHPQGVSPEYAFPETRAYARTMGSELRRKFFVLDRLWPQDGLAPVKWDCVELEREIAASGSFPVERPINIDPGLLNDCRLILASTKDYAHRIYRGHGIWEEITLVYREGKFQTHPWTYRDFGSGAYDDFFLTLRRDWFHRTRGSEESSKG